MATLPPDLLSACIHCGMCLPACPTYQATGAEPESPRGRLLLMSAWQKGHLDGLSDLDPHLSACLGCQACETACPSGVRYGDLLYTAREALAQERPALQRAIKRAIFRWVLPAPRLLNAMGTGLRWYQRWGVQRLVRRSGLLRLIPPAQHAEAFLPEVPAHQPLKPGRIFGNPSAPRVALLTGCVMDTFYNPVHWDTVHVLVANGYCVRIPEQTCCGALAHHAGETDIARALARQNLRTVLADEPNWIVLNSAGCGAALKHYDQLLADGDPWERSQAQTFSRKVVDALELLARKPLAPMPHPVAVRATYHAACHLHHAQGVREQPMAVLSQVPGVTWVPLAEAEHCCGSAGVYTLEQPELSQEILERKVGHILDTQATLVVTGNPGCLLQLQAGVRQAGGALSVWHPVSLLARAYGIPPHGEG